MPGGSAGKRCEPPASVTAVCTPISDGLVAVTDTPGSTAPLASATLPPMLPVLLAPPPWAPADAQLPSTHKLTASAMTACRISPPQPLSPPQPRTGTHVPPR